MKEVIKKINFKELIICILIPFIIGGLFSFLSGDISSIYEEFNKPFFAPPRIIFPIVWSIIYFLLGISSYIVYQTIKDDKNDMDNKKILRYSMQLSMLKQLLSKKLINETEYQVIQKRLMKDYGIVSNITA